MAWMTEDDLITVLLYSVAESMIRQVALREKPRSKKCENALKIHELIERYSNVKLYPGDLPQGYADVLLPYFDELGKDINKYIVDYETFMKEHNLLDNPKAL